MPNFTFLACFKPHTYRAHETKNGNVIYISLTDHIYKLHLYTLDEHNCLILMRPIPSILVVNFTS